MKNLLLIVALFLTGCEIDWTYPGTSEEEDCPRGKVEAKGWCRETVDFDLLSSGVKCYSHDDTSRFTSGSYQSITCTWHCTWYAGESRQYVSLDFVKGSSGWYLDHEYVSSGICY